MIAGASFIFSIPFGKKANWYFQQKVKLFLKGSLISFKF